MDQTDLKPCHFLLWQIQASSHSLSYCTSIRTPGQRGDHYAGVIISVRFVRIWWNASVAGYGTNDTCSFCFGACSKMGGARGGAVAG